MSEQEQIDPLADVADEDLKNCQPMLRQMIDHMAKRIEYAEGRRSVLVVVAGAVIAASVAMLNLVIGKDVYPPLCHSIISLGTGGIVLGVSLWFVHSRQTNFRYPFTAATETWKWFYRDAIPNGKEFHFPWFGFMGERLFEIDREKFKEKQRVFLSQKAPKLFNLRESTRQDIEQIFVLHVNEMYKNQFLTKLRSILGWGLIVNLGVAFVVFFISLAMQPWNTVKHSIVRGDILFVSADWRPLNVSRYGENEYVANLKVENLSSNELVLSKISVADKFGIQIPFKIEASEPVLPVKVNGRQTNVTIVTFWLQKQFANDACSIYLGQ